MEEWPQRKATRRYIVLCWSSCSDGTCQLTIPAVYRTPAGTVGYKYRHWKSYYQVSVVPSGFTGTIRAKGTTEPALYMDHYRSGKRRHTPCIGVSGGGGYTYKNICPPLIAANPIVPHSSLDDKLRHTPKRTTPNLKALHQRAATHLLNTEWQSLPISNPKVHLANTLSWLKKPFAS